MECIAELAWLLGLSQALFLSDVVSPLLPFPTGHLDHMRFLLFNLILALIKDLLEIPLFFLLAFLYFLPFLLKLTIQ